MNKSVNRHYLPFNANRRQFIATTTKALGSAMLLSSPLSSFGAAAVSENSVTVGQIMDLFISQVPKAPFEKTVDTLKAGNRDIKVSGVVTTMFATIEVIRKAIELGANFIIAHEPTFYNHADETDWLEGDEIYNYKANLLKEHNMAVWRNHDYIHSLVRDGVDAGVVAKLGWGNYYNYKTGVAVMPAITLTALIQELKAKFGISTVRYIGNLDQVCKTVLLLPGSAGGKSQITGIGKEKPDALVCGEIQEWETAEYVRDAQATGKKIALVVLGHIASEEPGSEYMANWLKEKVPGVKTNHVPAKNSLSFL